MIFKFNQFPFEMSTKSTQKKIQPPLFRFFDTKEKLSTENNNDENQRIVDCEELNVNSKDEELNVHKD